MEHISKTLKKNPPRKAKAKKRKQGKTGASKRKVIIPAVEVYANKNRFIIPKDTRTAAEKKKGGRPTVITQEVVRILEDAFCYDATVEEACMHAGISRPSYYEFVKVYPAFSDRVEDLRNAPFYVIRKKVIQVAEHDADMGLKFLERKKKMEFSTRAEVSHTGEVINRHHVDPEQAALIRNAMGNFARKVAKDKKEDEK